jgi:GNAT superfamily N-acetyltransferase
VTSDVVPDPRYTVRVVPSPTEADVAGLADVLVDCVAGGASIGFLGPLPMSQAVAFWRHVANDVERGARALIVAEDEDGIIGTVQLVLELPENQPHRADVAKLQVHRRARGQGVGAALVRAAEDLASGLGRTLLVLDTVTGSQAERLYTGLGWIRVGVIPNYALWPDGRPCDTTVFYRDLA